MQLEFVKPTADPHSNFLLYGPPKSGKTTGATVTAPGPILLLNGDRPNASRFAHSQRDDIDEMPFRGLPTFTQVADYLRENPNKYETVVLDPMGEVYTAVLDGLSGRVTRPEVQLRMDTGVHIERFCRFLCDQPVNAVFIAHEQLLENDSSEGPKIESRPLMGTKNTAPGEKLMAMVDAFGYTGAVQDEDTGDLKFVAQLADGKGRRGGSRFPEVLSGIREVNITEWVEQIREATAPKGAKKKEQK